MYLIPPTYHVRKIGDRRVKSLQSQNVAAFNLCGKGTKVEKKSVIRKNVFAAEVECMCSK